MPIQGSQPGNERRDFERIPARIEIHFRKKEEAARSLRAYSLNFSAGGLCVRTKRSYAVGESLRLAMKIDGLDYELQGAVAWVRDGAVGIRFENVSADDRARLVRVAESLRAAG